MLNHTRSCATLKRYTSSATVVVALLLVLLMMQNIMSHSGAMTQQDSSSSRSSRRSTSKKSSATEPPASIFDTSSIPTADEETLRQTLTEGMEPIIIFLYSKTDASSENFHSSIEQLVTALRPLIAVLRVDVTTQGGTDLQQSYGVSTIPALLMFNTEFVRVGAEKNMLGKMPVPYSGGANVHDMAKWAFENLSRLPIERVTDDHSLAYFLTSAGEKFNFPKILLVSNQSGTPPLFLGLANRFRYGATFGVATLQTDNDIVGVEGAPQRQDNKKKKQDGESVSSRIVTGDINKRKKIPFPNTVATSVIKRYGVRELPTLLAFTDGGGAADTPSATLTPGDLAAGFTAAGDEVAEENQYIKQVYQFIDNVALPYSKRKGLLSRVAIDEEKRRDKAREHAKLASVVEPIVIQHPEVWKEKCLMRHQGICLVVFRDKEELQEKQDEFDLSMYSEVSKKLATKVTSTPVQVAIVDGLTNYRIVQEFGIVNGIPDALAIHPAKKSYYNFIGSLSEANLVSFVVDKVVKSKAPKALPSRVPPFVMTPTKAKEAALENEGISDEF